MTAASNARGSVEAREASFGDEFAAYDRLPGVLRQALQTAPTNASAIALDGALREYRRRGRPLPDPVALRFLNEEFDEEVVAFGASYLARYGHAYPALASGVPRLGIVSWPRG